LEETRVEGVSLEQYQEWDRQCWSGR